MAVEESTEPRGPHLSYAREGALREVSSEVLVAQALELAKKIERLLESAPSVKRVEESRRASHSTRIARAMAASLVDELEVLARPSRETGAA